MKFPSLIRTFLLGLTALVSLSAVAEPYKRLPAPTAATEAAPSAVAPRIAANNTTYLQTCTLDISVQSCINNGSLGGVYTSDSAYSALSSLGCIYMYARTPLANKPGLDVYNCNSGSFQGATVFVFLDGNFSTSPAWTISVLY